MENYALQLKISLKGVKPLVWRRIVINADTPVESLHTAIQCVMPWTDSHMHRFLVGRQAYAPKYDDDLFDEESDSEDYDGMCVGDLLSAEGDKMKYEYDFGDGWEHQITVEKILPASEAAVEYITGKNACPPEDCGGIWGYQHLLDVLADPKNPEYKEMRRWLGLSRGEQFDPTFVDIDPDINEDLRDL